MTKKDSLKNGRYQRFTPQGKVYVRGFYKNNVRVGIWEFYNKNSGYIELIEKYDYANQAEIYYKDRQNAPAHFAGGMEEFNNYILSGKKIDSLKNIQGKMIIELTVDRTGNLKNFKIYRGLKRDVDSLVLELLKESPKWIPSTKDGIPIDETFMLPIEIK
jgi:Gram-negative bacterial tonB protein.